MRSRKPITVRWHFIDGGSFDSYEVRMRQFNRESHAGKHMEFYYSDIVKKPNYAKWGTGTFWARLLSESVRIVQEQHRYALEMDVIPTVRVQDFDRITYEDDERWGMS